MEYEYEISSSSLSFASMAVGGGGGGGGQNPPPSDADVESTPEYLGLSKLSSNLEKLLLDPSRSAYADAEIIVDGVPVGVHRCVLAAQSDYFHGLFSKPPDGENGQANGLKNTKPRYHMSDLKGYVGLEAFNAVLNYLYTGRPKPSPPEVSVCVDELCPHDACRPAINYVVELMYASSTFHIDELVKLLQRRLVSFVDKALIEDVIPILISAFRCDSKPLLSLCVQRISTSDLDAVSLGKEIPPEVMPEIKPLKSEPNLPQVGQTDRERNIRRIHKALDSDDVELVGLFLGEKTVNLNDAFALHYAAAYSDPKTFKKVLDLKSADLNLKNSRGLTVLHVAARRKDPSILIALLEDGANALETTPDGQTAVSICRRMTRPKDYNENIEKGKESNKDKVCIELLEQQVRTVSVSGRRPVQSEITDDDIHMLEYYESRVRMASMLFPAEAKVAMEIAGAEWTPLYKGLASKAVCPTVKDASSKDNGSMSAEQLHQKLRALRGTVEIGRRYFPNCSEEIVKFIDDMPDAFFLEKGSEEEQKSKKTRFMELRDDIQRAFQRDKAENKGPASFRSSPPSSSSSSSSSPRNIIRSKTRMKI